MSDKSAFITRATYAWARAIVRRPGTVLLVLIALGAVATYLTTTLRIESDQLSLISQDLAEVKEVKRVIDMTGGAGYLQFGIRGDDVPTLKRTADQLYQTLLAAKQPDGTPWVRFITYKVPVEFIQENMALFVKTEDLVEAKRRINLFLKDQLRRNNPFYMEIRKTEPVKLDLEDIVKKYSTMAKKSIRDEYYISEDQKMIMLLIKPMWNSTEIQKTKHFIDVLTGDAKLGELTKAGLLHEAGAKAGVQMVEDYDRMGDKQVVAFGFTGSYKTGVDDAFAIQESLDDVFFFAFLFIVIITIIFFRKWAPTVLVITGMALGTVLTMGFAKLTLGELNMVTSIIGAILMGFGIDYGIHFVYRTRIELGMGKRYDEAIVSAMVNAGRPALIAAVVTSGSFFVLLVSQFRGFSNFGFLAGFGTMIIGFTLFAWSPALLALAGRRDPEWPKRLIGVMQPPSRALETGETRIRAPKTLLTAALVVVAIICAFAVPWRDLDFAKGYRPTWFERLQSGVRFNYNTRALSPADLPSIRFTEEINQRFQISSDPVAVATKTIDEAADIWAEMTKNPETEFHVDTEKYKTVDQVVSLFSFVPPPKTAEANAKVLAAWREELKDIDAASLPPDLQEKAAFFFKVLEKKPFGAKEVPEMYASMFRSLPTTRPENAGYLTFIYPKISMWDGKNILAFADEVTVVRGKSGATFRGAGLPILYAKLARIVLWDGKLTVVLAAIWILLMHYLDFRSVKLAAASVIPLGVGLWMMLGLVNIIGHFLPDQENVIFRLNFMNLVILPILLGFGVSHGLYLLHRFLEGTSPMVALRSVGAAVASSTLTAMAGFASLFFASHNGLKSIGYIACLGLATTLIVSFTVLAAVLQLIYDKGGAQRLGEEAAAAHPIEQKAA